MASSAACTSSKLQNKCADRGRAAGRLAEEPRRQHVRRGREIVPGLCPPRWLHPLQCGTAHQAEQGGWLRSSPHHRWVAAHDPRLSARRRTVQATGSNLRQATVVCDQTVVLTGFYSRKGFEAPLRRIKFNDPKPVNGSYSSRITSHCRRHVHALRGTLSTERGDTA
jgi:hypothetical protein